MARLTTAAARASMIVPWVMVMLLVAASPATARGQRGVTVASAAASTWAAVGSHAGDGVFGDQVSALAVVGNDIYAGGYFTNAGGDGAADYIARWDGSTWHPLGSNGSGGGALNGRVTAIAASGTDLYVGGTFTDAGGHLNADHIAKWDGASWSALGSDQLGNGAIGGPVYAIGVTGTGVYVGGNFDNAANIPEADHIAKWSNGMWSALGSDGAGDGMLNGPAYAIAISGSDVYVGGALLGAPSADQFDYIAKWNGSAWSSLGGRGAINFNVYSLAVAGSNLYAGGSFVNAGGDQRADHVAKWNGSTWSPLGSDVAGTNGAVTADVYAIAAVGADVYVGGVFSDVQGIPEADNIAKWNGTTWSALGSNGPGNPAIFSTVDALVASGGTLYVGGGFVNADGIAAADYLAGWGLGSGTRRPDARVRLGTSGAYAGDNVYNTTGTGQTKTASTAANRTVTFEVSLQNDGTAPDSFTLKATGPSTTAFTVRYLKGTSDITAAVAGGTFTTASLAPGTFATITVKITIKATAPTGASVARIVTLSSVGNPSMKDAVKVVAKRT